jgi:hypothetical protein
MILAVSIKAVMPMESPPMANQLAVDEKLPLLGENKYRRASRKGNENLFPIKLYP